VRSAAAHKTTGTAPEESITGSYPCPILKHSLVHRQGSSIYNPPRLIASIVPHPIPYHTRKKDEHMQRFKSITFNIELPSMSQQESNTVLSTNSPRRGQSPGFRTQEHTDKETNSPHTSHPSFPFTTPPLQRLASKSKLTSEDIQIPKALQTIQTLVKIPPISIPNSTTSPCSNI